MMTIVYKSPVKSAKTDTQCYCCGKDVDPDKCGVVHVHGGGANVVTEQEAAALPENQDLGLQYVGRDCVKRHGLAAYVLPAAS